MPGAPPAGYLDIDSVTQEVDGPLRKFRGAVRMETTEMVLWADEIDYNEPNQYVEARGHVRYKNYGGGEEISASKVEYYLDDESGKFYDPIGTTPAHIEAKPGVLTSTSPFHFEGKWAERIGAKYILYNGVITNCKIPRPWWTLKGPRFDIIPKQRVLAYSSVFRVRAIPLFYAPVFYRSLAKVPRRSGFLMPNIGNSSTRGKMIGAGYFWAINRSFDVTYHLQDFTERGLAHHVEFRGKPRPGTDFDAIVFGVQDRGLLATGSQVPQADGSTQLVCPSYATLSDGECRQKQGGYSIMAEGRSDLGDGFIFRGKLNYLSSLQFRQSFTETFHEAIDNEVHSQGAITKHWSTYDFNVVFARTENFQSLNKGDSIIIRKLPELQFSSREKQISERILPIWVSFDGSAGLLQRSQPLFQTRQFTDRIDLQPRVTTALYWKGFQLIPSLAIRETHYGEQAQAGHIIGLDLTRSSREFFLDLIAPSLARIFKRKTILGDELKHVIEPRASFRSVSGILDFDKIIRFDETDLLSNTTELDISLTNRLYAKRNGEVSEVLSWELWQRRYFDPTFGGAIVPGQRNVVLSAIDLTPYAFLDQARNYSPVVSVLRASPKPGIGVDWRADYDPLRKRMVDSTFSTDVSHGNFYLSAGHILVHSDPDHLTPSSSQFRGAVRFGNPNHRGWNAGFTSVYDFRVGAMQYAITQVTYNTDCCGWSVQFQRINIVGRFENQFRVAFAIANISTPFGNLKKQERIF